MGIEVTHEKISGISDNDKPNQVQPSEWNDPHKVMLTGMLSLLNALDAAPDKGIFLLDANNAELYDFTTFMRGLMGSANSAGLATAAGLLATSGGTMTGAIVLPGDPSTALQAATKQYVDNAAAGFDIKQSVRAASTANVSIATAPASLDGVTGVEDDRWLLKNQSAPAENGIYLFVATGSPLVRADDFNAWDDIPGAMMLVEEGTANADSGWVSTANAGGTLGVTSITFSQFFGSGLFQPSHANLSTLAGLASVATLAAIAAWTSANTNTFLYRDGSGNLNFGVLDDAAVTLLAASGHGGQRIAMGLGTAAVLTAGVAPFNLVQLDGSSDLPAVDGAALLSVPNTSDTEARTGTNTAKALGAASHVAAHKPAFHATRTSLQSVTQNANTMLTGMTQNLDSDAAFNGSRFTPGVAGWYYAFVFLSMPAGTGSSSVTILKNGAEAVAAVFDTAAGNLSRNLSASGMVYLDADDYIEVFGVSSHATAGFNSGSHFGAFRLFA